MLELLAVQDHIIRLPEVAAHVLDDRSDQPNESHPQLQRANRGIEGYRITSHDRRADALKLACSTRHQLVKM